MKFAIDAPHFGPYADARALEAAKRELAGANVEAIALRETGG